LSTNVGFGSDFCTLLLYFCLQLISHRLWLAYSRALFSPNAHRLITELQRQSKKPYNKQLINLECSFSKLGLAILSSLSLSQYGKFLVWDIFLKCLWSKNNCCWFERLLKVKKSGDFLFGVSFFVLEIFTFLYYKWWRHRWSH